MSIILRLIPIKILKKYKIEAPVLYTIDKTSEKPFQAGKIENWWHTVQDIQFYTLELNIQYTVQYVDEGVIL